MRLVRMVRTAAGPEWVYLARLQPYSMPDDRAAMFVSAQAGVYVDTHPKPIDAVEVEEVQIDPDNMATAESSIVTEVETGAGPGYRGRGSKVRP